ncbi:3-hydroxyacyl-ACP dehydratase FabZ [Candidatus Omnitrophota bacterium]
MDIKKVLEILPHRYPFVMIDKVVEMDDKKIVGIKNVTINEYYFQGHFPDYPVMPGVLIIEAMAQLGGFFSIIKRPELHGKLALFLGVDKARFRKPVSPGDQLVIEMELLKARKSLCQMKGVARVGEDTMAEAEIMFGFTDKK